MKINTIKNLAKSIVDSVMFSLWTIFVWPFQAPTYIVLFGAPGSGKGTLAVELAKILGVHHLSTGEVFRREMRSNTDIGQLVSLWMKEGALAPDDVTFSVLAKELRSWRFRRGAILDGFPRNVLQAQLLNALLTEHGAKIDLVVALDVPEEELMKRLLSRGRPDDVATVIARRLQVNRDETAPLLPYYEGTAKVLRVALPEGTSKANVLAYVTTNLRETHMATTTTTTTTTKKAPMQLNKITRLVLAAIIALTVVAAYVAVWNSPMLQAAVFGVVIVAMLIFAIVMTLSTSSHQGENYH